METKILIVINCLFILGVFLSFFTNFSLILVKLKIKRKGGRLKEHVKKISKETVGESDFLTNIFYRGNSLYEKEVYSSCIILKNLAIVQKEIPMSQDFILEQLMENTTIMRPLYAEMLTNIRSDGIEEICEVMAKRVKTRSSKNFAMILEKIDKINPTELLEQISLLEEIILEERKTNRLKKADVNSMVITVFATSTIFALLLNFAVVVVFMDTLSMLGNLA